MSRIVPSLGEGGRAAATFWAQQAAEKALKGLLQAFRGSYSKTRSIRGLFEDLGLDLGLSGEELGDAFELTQYYYLSRYPDVIEGLPDEVISRRSAERAVKAARRIVEAAEGALEEASR